MIEMEDIPITKDEYIAMVKTINQLRKEKQHLIDKACEWLKENKNRYVYNKGVEGNYIPTCSNQLIEDFRKAMKGE